MNSPETSNFKRLALREDSGTGICAITYNPSQRNKKEKEKGKEIGGKYLKKFGNRKRRKRTADKLYW